MRLRGVFNPRLHICAAVVLIALSVWMVFGLFGHRIESRSAQVDLHLLPVGFLLGLGVGVPEGIWRLQAIRKALPDLDGKFFLSEAGVLRRFREGQNARALQQIGFGTAFAIWFILILHTDGSITLFGSFVFYILGEYLTGHLLPFTRLFLELKKCNSKGLEP